MDGAVVIPFEIHSSNVLVLLTHGSPTLQSLRSLGIGAGKNDGSSRN